MNYIVTTFLVSFFGTLYVVVRRVHENRTVGVPGDHSHDAYWPFNVIWNYAVEFLRKVALIIRNFSAPYIKKWVGYVASNLYRFTSSASHQFLQLSNLVHGKGTLKKNTGKTSLFIRDIAEYKKDINRK
ncbi:MAG: hypothetical protein UT05_C0009G0061 [Parcubacteria group bacterium GW2011_GWF2_38_76]|nr:MAG: hypothetical protein UT05_C0009G0061 [Parcubacteria group bacterium GW2011_GWF2_38_76]HBM45502.1 hypothetical protein [Patescibacteria group bacterium]